MEKTLVVDELSEKMEREAFIFKEVVWEIGNAPTQTFSKGSSPEFSFSDGSWDLKFDYASVLHTGLVIMTFSLRRIRSLIEEQEVLMKLYLRTSSGQKLGNTIRSHKYTSIDEIQCKLHLEFSKTLIEVAPNDKLVVDFEILTKRTAVESTSEMDVLRPLSSEFAERSGCRWLTVKEITWNIPCFSRPQMSSGSERKSLELSFANNTWVLYIIEYKDPCDDELIRISFLLRLQASQMAVMEQEICFKITLKTSDHKELGSQARCIGLRSLSPQYFVHFSLPILDWRRTTLLGRTDNMLIVVCRIYKMSTSVESDPQETCLRPVGNSATEGGQLTKVLLDFEKLLLSRENCDVIFQVRGQKFEAHRTIIGARSPVFASMLSHDMKEKNTGLIDIEDCDPGHFPDFLRFLYCGNVQIITSQNVYGLYRAADKYDVQDLKSECLEFMRNHLDVEHFCDVIALALRHDDAALVKHATDFFVENSLEIVQTVKWQVFLSENPTQGNELIIKALNRRSNP